MGNRIFKKSPELTNKLVIGELTQLFEQNDWIVEFELSIRSQDASIKKVTKDTLVYVITNKLDIIMEFNDFKYIINEMATERNKSFDISYCYKPQNKYFYWFDKVGLNKYVVVNIF
jgi:hypothetical protein